MPRDSCRRRSNATTWRSWPSSTRNVASSSRRETDLEARIKSYELAARMQLHAEGLLDLSHETPATRRLYGLDNPVTANFGTRCLMARRLVEEGVRFVQVTAPIASGTMPWDHHNAIASGLRKVCPQVDQPTAALIADLKQRGLLESTIVWWAGEFGRLPITQGGTGRDHNRYAFSLLLAGGGFRAGYVHGATDEFGYKSVEKIVTCPSLLATLMHQLGIDHNRLTYPHQGRDETLTDPRRHRRPGRRRPADPPRRSWLNSTICVPRAATRAQRGK